MTIATLLFALLVTTDAGGKGEPVLLDFHASWCGPCQQMRPEIRQLIERDYPIRSIDVDDSPSEAQRYKVSKVPTYVVVDPEGRPLARTSGYQPAAQLATFYREARTKALRAPAPEAVAPDEEREDDREGGDAEGDDRPAPRANPKPWETVVRIKVHGNGSIGFGSGTVIHSTPDESIILTCAHIFKIDGRRPVHPSKFPLKITIDLFDGKKDDRHQVHPIETVDGVAMDYDFDRDVGLIRMRPGRRLPASRVVPPSWVPQRGMRMTTVGCSLGQDATAWSTSIVNPKFRGLQGKAAYEAIECSHAPKQGRSGGGLYTGDGYVAGVCDFAEPSSNVGLYASPRSIHALLDRNQLAMLYDPRTRPDRPLLAKNRPAPSRPGAASGARLRAQSPDRDESEKGAVTIPPPELLGIRNPEVAQAQAASRPPARRGSWQRSTAPVHAQDDAAVAERTDLALPSSVDNDRFASSPDEPERPEPKPERSTPARSKSRWRPVKPESPVLSASAER